LRFNERFGKNNIRLLSGKCLIFALDLDRARQYIPGQFLVGSPGPGKEVVVFRETLKGV